MLRRCSVTRLGAVPLRPRRRGGKALLPFFKTLMNKPHVTVVANENVRAQAARQRLKWAQRVEVFPSNLPQVRRTFPNDCYKSRAPHPSSHAPHYKGPPEVTPGSMAPERDPTQPG